KICGSNVAWVSVPVSDLMQLGRSGAVEGEANDLVYQATSLLLSADGQLYRRVSAAIMRPGSQDARCVAFEGADPTEVTDLIVGVSGDRPADFGMFHSQCLTQANG